MSTTYTIKMPSTTYSVHYPGVTSAVYLTICCNEAGKVRSFFVNSKHMEDFHWVIALMTSYTRQLGAGVPVRSIIQDMKESFSPRGPVVLKGGIEAHSIINYFGTLVEREVDRIGVE